MMTGGKQVPSGIVLISTSNTAYATSYFVASADCIKRIIAATRGALCYRFGEQRT